jgi:glutathione S-transferase
VKLYDCTTAPSPRRVRIFLAEKGISVPMVQVDLRHGEQLGAAFRAINPEATVPVLELDSGIRIADIIGICRYFEETHPTPPLMGVDAEDKAIVEIMPALVRARRLLRGNGSFSQRDAGPHGPGASRSRELPPNPRAR